MYRIICDDIRDNYDAVDPQDGGEEGLFRTLRQATKKFNEAAERYVAVLQHYDDDNGEWVDEALG